jgi:hypothetical protein
METEKKSLLSEIDDRKGQQSKGKIYFSPHVSHFLKRVSLFRLAGYSCVIKYKKDSLLLSDIPLDLEFIEQKIVKKWPELQIVPYRITYSTWRRSYEILSNRDLRECLVQPKPVIKIRYNCIEFSKYRLYSQKRMNNVSRLWLTNDSSVFPPADFSSSIPTEIQNKINLEADIVQLELQRMASVVHLSLDANDYTKKEFISPVLVGAVRAVGGFQIFPEQIIVGQYGKGVVDYCLTHRHLNIVLTEVKEEELGLGLMQNLVQQVSSLQALANHLSFRVKDNASTKSGNERANKKRKYDEMFDVLSKIPTFGIITNGEKWMVTKMVREEHSFKNMVSESSELKLILNAVNDSESSCQLVQIKCILQTLAAVLIEQKKVVEDSNELDGILRNGMVPSLQRITSELYKKCMTEGENDEDDEEE